MRWVSKMNREAEIQDALKNLIKNVAEKFRFEGLDITDVKRDHPVDNREVDIVVFTRGGIPFMFIETKRKGKEPSRLFDPLDVSVVGQVMSYVAIYKKRNNFVVPFVATANPSKIAIFRTPENIEDYVNVEAIHKRDYKNVLKPLKYELLLKEQMERYEKLGLNEEYISVLLGRLASEYREKRIIKVEPTRALVDRFREFVDRISERCRSLVERKISDEPLRTRVKKLGYKLDPENLPLTVANVTRMMTYVLMNKLIFYKILEKTYRLPPLSSLDSSSQLRFGEDLAYHFRRAVEVTEDFEPIFKTGVYDFLPIPDDPELMEYINDFIYTLDSVEIVKIGEQIGYMYEGLIPPEERHQLGQFYTPPWVCELITKWCIKSPEDVVLDPGVGSGGFLLKAYGVLLEEKTGSSDLRLVRKPIHERILNQLYALDINPFPTHLSAMGLSMRNVRVLSTMMNIIPADFFSLQPEQEVLTPYTMKTVAGEIPRKFVIPQLDAVIGNPPYTRWTEIPEETQILIRKRLGRLMREYGLMPQVSRGVEPGIYTYWIMHATDFLKEGGRLGMIISNTWLQTDYGIGFGNFLLDNFRVKAIIDFGAKLFKEALVTTCIALAEKESDETKRLENKVAFVYVPPEKIKAPELVKSEDVEELLEAVGAESSKGYTVTLVDQRELLRDRKWIDMFFKTVDISDRPLMTKLGELFEPLRGNTAWAEWALSHGRRPDPGSSEFHYLSPSKIKEYKLDKWSYPDAPLKDALVYPAITRARHNDFFTFTEEEWKEMHKSDDRCYMFVCHKPRRKLPKEVTDYVKWGETECRAKGKARQIVGRGRLASETEAAKARAKETRRFYGWYDLGGIVPAPIFAIRRAWRKSKFSSCEFPVGISSDAFIGLMLKKNVFLDRTQIKALLAYLNSSFAQSYVESKGLKSPGGIIQLDVGIAREMPILDMRKLSDKQLNLLAKLFDELEHEARKVGGTSGREDIEKLKPKIYEIDRAIAALLGIKNEDVEKVETQVDLMVERRVSAAKRAL